MRRPAWAELVRSGLAQTRAGFHEFGWYESGFHGPGQFGSGFCGPALVLLLRVRLFSLLLVAQLWLRVPCYSRYSRLVVCCVLHVACVRVVCRLSLVALRLRLVLRATCCLRAHSTSLPHCAFSVAFFFAPPTKLCPDFDFSGRELRL